MENKERKIYAAWCHESYHGRYFRHIEGMARVAEGILIVYYGNEFNLKDNDAKYL